MTKASLKLVVLCVLALPIYIVLMFLVGIIMLSALIDHKRGLGWYKGGA